MPMPARAQRLARGWLVGLVATTVAAVSHSLAGGYRPGILSFGVALIFAGMLGTAVIGTKPSLPRLAVTVGGAQLAFHLLFSMLGSGDGASVTRSDGMGSMASMDASPVAGSMTMSTHDHASNPAMWLAHAIAAVLTLLFLRHAELAVWTMLTRLVRAVVTRLTVGPSTVLGTSLRLPARPPAVAGRAERALVASASRRGPPLLAF